MADQQKRKLHPVLALALVVLIAGVAAATALGDWKVLVYGACAFLVLGIVGGMLAERGR